MHHTSSHLLVVERLETGRLPRQQVEQQGVVGERLRVPPAREAKVVAVRECEQRCPTAVVDNPFDVELQFQKIPSRFCHGAKLTPADVRAGRTPSSMRSRVLALFLGLFSESAFVS